MKSTAFGGRLLLVAVLAVSSVAAASAPSQVDSQEREALEKFLEQNPSVAQDLYPQLVNAAKHVSLDVDPDVVLALVENYVKDQTDQDTVKEQGAVSRQKRRTTLFGRNDYTENNSQNFSPKFGDTTATNGNVHFDFSKLFG